MVYELEGTPVLFIIDRSEIIDITVGDTISIQGFGGVMYTWTQQDSELVENNPDDDVFLQIERSGENYKATGIILHSGKTV